MELQLLFLIATITVHVYCQSDCEKYGRTNTMCVYPAGSGCTKARRGVDQTTINTILRAHNSRRNRVASGGQAGKPRAANMLELTWNSDLAAVAQRWADQCTFAHDSVRNTPQYQSVGQNVAIVWTTSTTIRSTPDFDGNAVAPWYNEVSQFNSSNISPFRFTTGTGHYTQLAWAETRQVGCGYAYYTINQRNTKLYVCNYGPAGNIIGGTMYRVGTACSSCSGRCSTNHNALCRN